MTRFASKKVLVSILLFLLCSFAPSQTQTQTPTNTTVYIYDELGRLKAVITPSGDVAVYTYDAAGNILSITRQLSTTVSLIEFTPDKGAPGTAVTIYGTGFSLTAGQNSVSFNGVAGTVTAASGTQLIAVVPAGATTGPISVTTPTGSVTSTTDFEVLQSLSITGFTPTIGTPGTAVQITGTDFAPVAANNQLKFNITPALASAATATTIDTTVPSGATSGHITLTTPGGTVVSSGDFFVPPSPFTAASVDHASRIVLGETKPLSVNAANRIAMLVFDGTVGQRISLQATGSTISSSTVRVIKPDGTNLFNPTSLSGNWFVDALTLTVTGTHTIIIDPNSTFTGSMNLTLHNIPADATATITAGGPAVTVTTMTPGQNANVTFEGATGQRVSLNLTSVTINSSSVTIRRPDGTTLATAATVGTGGFFFDTMTLPASGTYSIFIDPKIAATGSMTLTLYEVPPTSSSTIVIGTAVTITINIPGENTQLTFTGTAGQIVNLEWSGTIGYSNQPHIVKPDGTRLTTPFWYDSNGFRLPVTGTYTIPIDPAGSNTGQTTFILFEIPQPVTATLVADGPPLRITTPVTGQMANLTFSGTAGQRVSLRIRDIDTGPYPNWSSVEIVKPDGSYLMDEFAYPEGYFDDGFLDKDRLIDTLTLPVTGTYTVNVYPEYSSGSYTFELFNVPPDITATIAPDGVPVTVTTTVPGQNAVVSFNGTAGQRVSLKATNTIFPYSSIDVYSPTGTFLGGFAPTGLPGRIGFEDAILLPLTGTYTIVVEAYFAFPGSTTLTLYNVPAPSTVGTLTFNGPPVTFTTTAPGQDVDFTFNGTAGQRMSLKVLGPVSSDIIIRRPNSQTLVPTKFIREIGTTTAELFETIILPTTGTYRVTVNTWFTPGDISVSLYEVPPDINDGVITIGGPPVTVTSTGPRENRVLTFNGTQGQIVHMMIDSNNSWLNHVFVNQPSGFSWNRRFADDAKLRVLEAIALPATGTYTVITELYGVGDSVTLTLGEGGVDVRGTIAADGQPTIVTVPASRQNALFTFEGVAGQRVTLKTSDVTYGPFGTGTVGMSGDVVDCCGQHFIGGDLVTPERFQVRDLTTTGTQSIFVNPNFDFIGSVTLRLSNSQPDITGTTLTVNGPPVSFSTVPGQNAVYTVEGSSGQQLTLHFTNNTMGKIIVEVIRPDDSPLSFHVNSGASFDMPTFVLPFAGTYKIRIDPYRNNTGSVTFNVTSP
jgi:YD repeat-containing protein